jgi:16S rRNA (adenine1518-N6/adenine1519-N6)-dimethyltransferase
MTDLPRAPLPRARRSLGQNFLVNEGVKEKIVAALEIAPEDWVVEIGPGPGALTSRLVARAARVIAVELDPDLAAALPARVTAPERLEVVRADAAGLDWADLAARAGRPVRGIGNLPFNAAAPILRQALDAGGAVARLVLMFQREVALRLVASPGTKAYGLLSVVTQQRAEVRRLFDVAPGSFVPRPNVLATVVRLNPRSGPGSLPRCCLEAHDRIVRAAFGKRRKTLRNSLVADAPWPTDRVRELLARCGLDEGLRSEQVPVTAFAALGRALCSVHGEGGAADPVPGRAPGPGGP